MSPALTGATKAATDVPAFAEFPKEEFEARYWRLRIEMERHGLAAIIATSEPNFRYLSGAHNQRWPNVLRPHAVLLPLVDEPTLIQPGTDNWGLTSVTWIRDLRGFGGNRIQDGYGAHIVAMIAEIVAEKGIRRGRIGIERGWQMRAGLSIDDFQELERRLAPITLVDSAPIWWDVRMIKSPLKIDCIREAGRITSAAYRDVRRDVALGMTEKQVEQMMCASSMKHGAERPTYTPVNIHAGHWPKEGHIVFGFSTYRRLENDMVIDMDGGCTYKGYWSDFSRTFAVGKPPELARTAYRVAQESIEAGLAAVRPGRPITDVYQAMVKAFNASNTAAKVSETGMSESGINGHGLGLAATERPYVNGQDQTIMSKELYFTIDPIFTVEGNAMMLGEEMLVVTDDGYELLSERADLELPILF